VLVALNLVSVKKSALSILASIKTLRIVFLKFALAMFVVAFIIVSRVKNEDLLRPMLELSMLVEAYLD
jgi:hypothetical protein